MKTHIMMCYSFRQFKIFIFIKSLSLKFYKPIFEVYLVNTSKKKLSPTEDR